MMTEPIDRCYEESFRGAVMKLASTVPGWILALGSGLAGCGDPLYAPSAFSEERYLCDADHRSEFDARVAECRDAYLRDRSCAGLVSFRGTIELQQVVVDSQATLAVIQDQMRGGGIVTHALNVWASSPYFGVRLLFVDPSAPASGEIGGVGSASNSDYIDLEARGGNYLSTWINETRDIEVLSPTEVRFTFSADLTKGGHLDGCLDVFL
jgi:hypothetical protein